MPYLFALALALATAGSLLTGCHTTNPSTEQQRPNILFLFADDQRPDAVGAFGNEHIQTPHIDSIVRRGSRFRNNYCMGSWHGAVCIPSRAMLMSGRTLHRVKADLAGVRTLPRALAENGYVTYGTGKWHNGKAAFERTFRHGKNVLLGGMSNHNKVPIVDLDTESRQFSQKRTGAKHSSELFADAAVDYLQEHHATGKNEPFFLYVAFTAPHDPRDPPTPYRERYYQKNLPLPANYRPQVEWFGDPSWAHVRDEMLAPFPRTKNVIRDQLAEYYGLITHMDAQIGRVLKALEATGQADNTIIVYAADHGLAVGSHGLLGKQSLFEHSMGCPLVFAGPGIPKGRTHDAFTYLFDVYPTLCALTGTEIDDTVEGHSLVPVLVGEAQKVRDSIFTMYAKTQRAVRDARFKLIRYPQIDKTLLFDLQQDPNEMHDLSQDPGNSAVLARLKAMLLQWQVVTDDKGVPWTARELREPKKDLSDTKRTKPRKPDRWQPRWIREKYFPKQVSEK